MTEPRENSVETTPGPAEPAAAPDELLIALQEAMRTGDAAAQVAAMAALRDAFGKGGGQPAPASRPPQAAGLEMPPIDWSTEPAPLFANGLQILHRPTDFAVVFTDHTPFPGRRSPDGTEGTERAAVVCSLRTHPAAFFQMVCAMASSWNRFASTMIDPRMRQPRFRLFDAGELQLEQAPQISLKE